MLHVIVNKVVTGTVIENPTFEIVQNTTYRLLVETFKKHGYVPYRETSNVTLLSKTGSDVAEVEDIVRNFMTRIKVSFNLLEHATLNICDVDDAVKIIHVLIHFGHVNIRGEKVHIETPFITVVGVSR